LLCPFFHRNSCLYFFTNQGFGYIWSTFSQNNLVTPHAIKDPLRQACYQGRETQTKQDGYQRMSRMPYLGIFSYLLRFSGISSFYDVSLFLRSSDHRGCQMVYFFKPKIPLWVNFVRPCKGSCWYILWPFRIFYGNMEYFGKFVGHFDIFSHFVM
jgi:hypothetical protein